jgi:hypothetical protein
MGANDNPREKRTALAQPISESLIERRSVRRYLPLSVAPEVFRYQDRQP